MNRDSQPATNQMLTTAQLVLHRDALRDCQQCPKMIGPVVTGLPVQSNVILVGQAPGDKEGGLGRPFAWTAGKTLFNWFASIGLEEQDFRERVYMAAVCRCFPGKNPKGGDRVPDREEIATCASWLEHEFDLLQPRLLIPVGKLAIAQFLPVDKLTDVIGQVHRLERGEQSFDVIPLPHPSGASTWHRTQPGKDLLASALTLLAQHRDWQALRDL